MFSGKRIRNTDVAFISAAFLTWGAWGKDGDGGAGSGYELPVRERLGICDRDEREHQHSGRFGHESFDVRTIRDLHGDANERRRPCKAPQKRTHETDGLQRQRDVEREHGLRG